MKRPLNSRIATFKCLFNAITVLLFIQVIPIRAQDNLATQLGYDADDRLLIIHADDIGVSHSENLASLEAIENGSVNSGSVMMPCPWVLEVADYATSNKETHDLGIHLVLTSEWKHYRWGPVSSSDEVPSLLGDHGYFVQGCLDTLNIQEAEIELRAQIDRAYAMGIEPTHFDSHMGCLFQNQELIELYLKLGQDYQVPVMVSNDFPTELLQKYDVRAVLTDILTIGTEDYKKGVEAYYTNSIRNLKPGVSTILIHTAYDNEEMKGMNIDHPDWGNEWRQKDFDFFTSDTCRDLLKSEKIKLVTWRQIKDHVYPSSD